MTTEDNTPQKAIKTYTNIRIRKVTKAIARRMAFDSEQTLIDFLHDLVLAEHLRRRIEKGEAK